MTLAQTAQVRAYMEQVAHEFRTATALAEHTAERFQHTDALEDDASPLWQIALSCIKEVGP